MEASESDINESGFDNCVAWKLSGGEMPVDAVSVGSQSYERLLNVWSHFIVVLICSTTDASLSLASFDVDGDG